MIAQKLNIIYCDCDNSQLSIIKNTILNFKSNNNTLISFTYFDSVDSITTKAVKKLSPDVLFIDISSNNEIIEKINKLAESLHNIKVVYITGYTSEYSQELFVKSGRLRPYGLMKKPIDSEVFSQLLTIIISDIYSSGFYEIPKNRHHIKVHLADVIYAESFKRKLTLHFLNGQEISFYKSIGEFSKELPENFVRCHKSYIVNLNYVTELDEKNMTVKLKNDFTVYIGDKMKQDFLNSYYNRQNKEKQYNS